MPTYLKLLSNPVKDALVASRVGNAHLLKIILKPSQGRASRVGNAHLLKIIIKPSKVGLWLH